MTHFASEVDESASCARISHSFWVIHSGVVRLNEIKVDLMVKRGTMRRCKASGRWIVVSRRQPTGRQARVGVCAETKTNRTQIIDSSSADAFVVAARVLLHDSKENF